ncbi:hypothetical protein IWW34DRAFT_711911 [Fusarium oxysporum f. sp. albedinis]|nr:hypothetical protein IWW34DRAFT_711911 [Fusarium oxysporum f. sp. albedinis]
MPTVIGRLTKQVLYGALFLYFGNKPNSLTVQQPTSMPCYIRHKTSASTYRPSACFNRLRNHNRSNVDYPFLFTFHDLVPDLRIVIC